MAQVILSSHREALDTAMEAILVRETLTGDELLEIMERCPASTADVPVLEIAAVCNSCMRVHVAWLRKRMQHCAVAMELWQV